MALPDPMTEADAYRRYLLNALGGDDPAVTQAATPALVRQLIDHAAGNLRTPPAPGEWSVIELIGHMVDSELVSAARYRWILAQDEPDLVGYDQDLWVSALRHGDDDPERLLAQFAALRAANLELWQRSTPADRARVGIHRERGRESFDLLFRLLAGHDRVHLAQARAALETVRTGK
jgi:DinB superfamily